MGFKTSRNPTGGGTNLDREGAHHDLLIPGGGLALQLAGYVWDHVVQVPVLQLLGDPLLLVFLAWQSLGTVVAVPVVMLRDGGDVRVSATIPAASHPSSAPSSPCSASPGPSASGASSRPSP